MARKVYNQKNLTLTIDGVTIQDFHEGAPVIYTKDGGEVQKTQGTDGASVNIATDQGATLQFTLRETSRSRAFLNALRLAHYNGGSGAVVILRTGADVLEMMVDGYISREGQLTTGDTKMGGVQYTITSADDSTEALAIASALIM